MANPPDTEIRYVFFEKNTKKPTELTDFDYQKVQYEYSGKVLRSIVHMAQEKFPTIFQMVRDDDLTEDTDS